MLQFIFVGHFQSVSKYLNVKNMRLKYVYNILLKQTIDSNPHVISILTQQADKKLANSKRSM